MIFSSLYNEWIIWTPNKHRTWNENATWFLMRVYLRYTLKCVSVESSDGSLRRNAYVTALTMKVRITVCSTPCNFCRFHEMNDWNTTLPPLCLGASHRGVPRTTQSTLLYFPAFRAQLSVISFSALENNSRLRKFYERLL